MPQPGNSDEHISLTRGLNIVTVCLVAASLIAPHLLAGPLWLKGSQLSPALKSLSGPVELQSLKRVSYPGESRPSFFLPAIPGFQNVGQVDL